MINHIHDEVFGELDYRPGDLGNASYGFWYTTHDLPLLGQAVLLYLEATPKQGPTERQKQIYQDFREYQMDLKAELQEALFAHYQGVRPQYLGFSSVEDDPAIPPLNTPDQIWELITPSSVLVYRKPSALSESNQDLGISWETTWDTEMYLHADYRGLVLISVDQE